MLKKFVPPIFYEILGKYRKRKKKKYVTDQNSQFLDCYYTEEMANVLETWGKDHVWNEIECLLVNCEGSVLDIACGTGVNILSLSRFKHLDIYGFDISELLIGRAKEKGIDPQKLKIENATATSYKDNEFHYSYSIGSLEHFTEEGIDGFLKEANRYTSKKSFHMIPVSENNKDNGWIHKDNQSYFNNSIEWWTVKFTKHFNKVYVITSGWKDAGTSVGKWFICFN